MLGITRILMLIILSNLVVIVTSTKRTRVGRQWSNTSHNLFPTYQRSPITKKNILLKCKKSKRTGSDITCRQINQSLKHKQSRVFNVEKQQVIQNLDDFFNQFTSNIRTIRYSLQQVLDFDLLEQYQLQLKALKTSVTTVTTLLLGHKAHKLNEKRPTYPPTVTLNPILKHKMDQKQAQQLWLDQSLREEQKLGKVSNQLLEPIHAPLNDIITKVKLKSLKIPKSIRAPLLKPLVTNIMPKPNALKLSLSRPTEARSDQIIEQSISPQLASVITPTSTIFNIVPTSSSKTKLPTLSLQDNEPVLKLKSPKLPSLPFPTSVKPQMSRQSPNLQTSTDDYKQMFPLKRVPTTSSTLLTEQNNQKDADEIIGTIDSMLKPVSSTIIFKPTTTAVINKINSQNEIKLVKPTLHQLLLDAKKNLLNFDILNAKNAEKLQTGAVTPPLNADNGESMINQEPIEMIKGVTNEDVFPNVQPGITWRIGMNLMRNFDDQLRNPASKIFQLLKTHLEREMMKLYNSNESFLKCQIKEFLPTKLSNGIKVVMELQFSKPSIDNLLKLRMKIYSGSFGQMETDPNSFEIRK